MRIVYFAFAGAVLGALAGLVSALLLSGLLNSGVQRAEEVRIEGWSSDWSLGTEAPNRYLKAWVARYGLLAMQKSEAVYFRRLQDDDGAPLREGCAYEVSGGALPAQWWSVTLYDRLGYLPMNTDAHLSIDATRAPGAHWRFQVSARPPEGDMLWVSSRNSETFDLTLRLYQPDPAFLAEPLRWSGFPRIHRLRCESEDAS